MDDSDRAAAPTLSDSTDLTIVVNVNAKAEPHHHPLPAVPDAAPAPSSYRAAIGRFVDELQARLGIAESEERGLFEVISRSMDTMQTAIARQRLAAYSPDLIVEIPRNACAFHEFFRARERIVLGRERAERTLSGD